MFFETLKLKHGKYVTKYMTISVTHEYFHTIYIKVQWYSNEPWNYVLLERD